MIVLSETESGNWIYDFERVRHDQAACAVACFEWRNMFMKLPQRDLDQFISHSSTLYLARAVAHLIRLQKPDGSLANYSPGHAEPLGGDKYGAALDVVINCTGEEGHRKLEEIAQDFFHKCKKPSLYSKVHCAHELSEAMEIVQTLMNSEKLLEALQGGTNADSETLQPCLPPEDTAA